MARLEEYANKYKHVRMERRDGILQMTFHTDGDTLQWGGGPHEELPRAFADVGNDPDNKVVIMTGAGDAFTGPRAARKGGLARNPRDWYATFREGKQLLTNLLDIDAPMIAAINGPALRHSELPLLCDIVLAADHAEFQDSGHFPNSTIPGDGMHIVYPLLMGMNRGRYFLLTGQTLSAAEAKEMGLVAELLPRARLLARAWELAEEMATRPPLVLRYSRIALTLHLKRLMHDMLGYGITLEGHGAADAFYEGG